MGETLKADAALGNIDTSIIPSGNLLFAPRFGFNWDVSGTGKTFLRGGIGVFSGCAAGDSAMALVLRVRGAT